MTFSSRATGIDLPGKETVRRDIIVLETNIIIVFESWIKAKAAEVLLSSLLFTPYIGPLIRAYYLYILFTSHSVTQIFCDTHFYIF